MLQTSQGLMKISLWREFNEKMGNFTEQKKDHYFKFAKKIVNFWIPDTITDRMAEFKTFSHEEDAKIVFVVGNITEWSRTNANREETKNVDAVWRLPVIYVIQRLIVDGFLCIWICKYRLFYFSHDFQTYHFWNTCH